MMTTTDLLIMFGPLLGFSILLAIIFGIYSYVSFKRGFD
jgi:hypothetical protein